VDTSKIDRTVDEAIKQLYEKITDNIDVSFVEGLPELMGRLKKKQEDGTLGLRDYSDLLKIYKNVMVPAAMKQQVDKLNAIKAMIKAAQ
jgi:hypothetical protein